MLGIGSIATRGGGYYLNDLARELGPDGSEHPGEWMGAGADGLRLRGLVRSDHLEDVLSGRKPGSERSLLSRQRSTRGFDLTFSAPKSVSVLFALGSGPQSGQVVEAHRRSVEAAMSYVGRRALAVRRGTGEDRTVLPTGGPVAAVFTHGLSRALDPHLHSHVVVANLVQGFDGRWSAIDGRGLFAHRSAAGSVYESHLRHELTATLGVDWEIRRNGTHEIVGVDPAVIGAFSARGADIRSHLAARRGQGMGQSLGQSLGHEKGAWPGQSIGPRPGRRERHIAWAVTRDPKSIVGDNERLVARWRSAARDALGSELEVGAIVGRALAESERLDEHRFEATLMTSPHAGATRRAVVAAWANGLARGAPVCEIERSSDWVLARAGSGHADISSANVGVAEPVHQLSGIVPPRYLLRSLGPRPISAMQQRAWADAANSIDHYRQQWGIVDPSAALGREPDVTRMPIRQLADRIRAVNRVEVARRRLDRLHAPDRLLSIGRG